MTMAFRDLTRAKEFVRRNLSGETLEDIGRSRGLTRERVRQIVRGMGVSVDDSKRAAKQARIGKRFKTKVGYSTVYMPNHPRADRKGRVLEHIIVAERKLGRALRPHESTHHINGIRSDNRAENIQVLSSSDHSRLHHRKYTRALLLDALRFRALEVQRTPTVSDLRPPEFPIWHTEFFYGYGSRPYFRRLRDAAIAAGLEPNVCGEPGHGGRSLTASFVQEFGHLRRYRSVEEMADALHGGLCSEHERHLRSLNHRSVA